MDIELREALGDLVRAHNAHAKACDVFLRATAGGDPDDEQARANEMEKAHLALADAGREVAQIAMRNGVTGEQTACHKCGEQTEIDLLDSKDDGSGNFTILECRHCYGPGWSPP